MTVLPQGWTVARFEEIVAQDAPIIYGILQPGPEYTDGVKYVRPTEIQDGVIDLSSVRSTSPEIAAQYARSKLAAGDVILSIVGTIGKVALVPNALDGANITQSSCRLRPDRRLTDEIFLQNFLKAPQAVEQYDRKRMGTAVPRLNLADVRQFEIPLPPLPEQRRIVRKLDTLSARSTTARTHLTAIEKLVERYKRAVAQQLIHAQEWETVPFLDACDAYQPRTISKSELVPDGAYPVYGANGVIGRYDQYNHEDPQLLITCRGATCGTVNVSQPFSWITGNAMVVDGTKSGLSLAFLREYFAKGFDFTTVISGSAQPQITRQSLAQLRMPVVDENQQREIVRRIETAFAKIDRLAAEAEKALKLLGHLDQRILAKAFAGDLVPQDPNDEPAETLLARIRDARATAPKARRGRK